MRARPWSAHTRIKPVEQDSCSKSYDIDDVLNALNRHRVRATYGVVGILLGCSARQVAPTFLGDRRPYASWVVSKANHMPTGYAPNECHPDLQSNSHVITDAEELVALVERSSL